MAGKVRHTFSTAPMSFQSVQHIWQGGIFTFTMEKKRMLFPVSGSLLVGYRTWLTPGSATGMSALVSWLSSNNYRLYHDTTSSIRTTNTGLWFLASDEFEEWLSSAHGVLWVTGMPGAGKTVLASHSVDHLVANVVPAGTTNVALTYVYCRYLDNCKAGHILRSLIHQLVEDHRRAYSIVRSVFEDHKLRQVQLTDSRAADLLGNILRLFEKAFIIIDGLDEVPEIEKSKVLLYIRKLPAHRLIFSRPMTFYMDLLPSATLSIEARNADIEIFVLDRINSHPRLQRLLQHSETLVQEVTSRIQRKASGM
ncbi:hypothetical protein FA13DRAFT_302243 [Coprinellus micaceus]|uniref:Nephrocystin 3-like N-terminal domain-containing protein n=1 Tax=Coprinellus micaceus TaxID=71717 RepID=A0A4Y7SDU5_COPMI|nr:hypothetical protein FA13DRAFT_302243 [Coprinellus micaceus]